MIKIHKENLESVYGLHVMACRRVAFEGAFVFCAPWGIFMLINAIGQAQWVNLINKNEMRIARRFWPTTLGALHAASAIKDVEPDQGLLYTETAEERLSFVIDYIKGAS